MKPPRDNSKLIETEVIKPGAGSQLQIGNVANLSALGPLDQVVKDIRSDHALFENHSKMAAFLALRIGLRLVWVKNNSGHGSLDPFIAEHFPAISRRSLTNYIRIADAFVSDSNLRDKKTHKLTDSKAPKAILELQLELFTDPKAKLDIHCKQLVEWVSGRGLTQIYRDLSQDEEAALPPTGHQGSVKKKKQTPEQIQREAFTASLIALKRDFSDAKWKHLFEKDRLDLETWLAKAGQTVKEHNASCAKEARRKS